MFLKLVSGVVGNGATLAVLNMDWVWFRLGGSNTRVTENRFCSHDGSIHKLFTIANDIAIAIAMILNDVANSVADSNGAVTVKVQ